jgi:large subunit ribosomal protein L25
MATQTTRLNVSSRPPEGSRATRRLRRRGFVPGIVYGAGDPPQPFEIEALELRNQLAHAGAVIEISIDGGPVVSTILKDQQKHPVRGELMHVDLLRVNMNETIQTTVQFEIVGGDSAPGVVEGGVLDQQLFELNVEALPGNLPDVISFDASELEINATVTLDAVTPPEGVTFTDDPETVVATITAPTAEPTEDEIETETAVVGADGEPVAEGEAEEAKGEGATGDEADESAS